MSFVNPERGRSQIEDEGYKIRIIVPSKKRIFIILFICAWLGGWLMGECSVLGVIFSMNFGGFDFFLFFWLCAWTLGGAYAIFTVLWNIAGKEIITFSQDILKIERKIFGIGTSREYLLSEAKNFQVDVQDYWGAYRKKNGFRIGEAGGNILFYYGMRTVRFAQDVDQAEADYIIRLLMEKGFIRKKEDIL